MRQSKLNKTKGDIMSLILTRKGEGTGEEVYSHIDTRIDEIMSEELKAKKISLTESEREKIMEKCPIEKIDNDVDKLNFTLGFCYWEILDLIDICGYLLSTNQNLANILSLKETGEIDCIHDLEKELELLTDRVRFINELYNEEIIKKIKNEVNKGGEKNEMA